MQSGHGENSQAEGGVEESEPDEIFSCHSQPTILSKELKRGSPVPGRACRPGRTRAGVSPILRGP